jgi:hypothetical protein
LPQAIVERFHLISVSFSSTEAYFSAQAILRQDHIDVGRHFAFAPDLLELIPTVVLRWIDGFHINVGRVSRFRFGDEVIGLADTWQGRLILNSGEVGLYIGEQCGCDA